MQEIGILGGMAPESTLEYYRILVEASHDRAWEKRYPHTHINSLNFETFYDPLSKGDDERVAEVLTSGIQSLERAGADFGLLASNTPHRYFDDVDANTSIPLLSIVDATAEAAIERSYERIGLLGTSFTMEGDFYPSGFEDAGLDLIVPSESDRDWINEIIFDELTRGEFYDETKAGLLDVIEWMEENGGIDAVALACTELPLIIDESNVDVPVLNTTELHATAAFQRAIAEA